MPALTDTRSKILVTGANGFIATWIVGDLLKKGYSVRASVRTTARGERLAEIYKSFGDKLEIVAVGDMIKDGAFDEAVKGCDGIIHTAAAVDVTADDPKDIIDPCVKGVLGILESAVKDGTVKQIVVTSTCATVALPPSPPIIVSEETFLWDPVVECEEKGKDASGGAKYAASKILAEKAARDFYKKHKESVSWDLVILNPPWVFGPWLNDTPTFESLNFSNKTLYNTLVKGDFFGGSPLTTPGHGWVDVRDIAQAHVLALETPAACGERIIICGGGHVWQDWLDAAAGLSPPPYSKPIVKGETGRREYNITLDTSKEKRIFGIKFRTMDETVKDVLTDVQRHGW